MQRLRRAGLVPGVLYGLGKEPALLQFRKKALDAVLREGNRVVELDFGGRHEPALLKEVQFDHLGDHVVHADFMRVDLHETVRIRVPIRFTGIARGQTAGGVLEHKLTELEIECLPDRIPEEVVVSVQDLDVGQSLQAADLTLPEGVACALDGESLIASVTVLAEEEAEAAPEGEEAAPQPEVIHAKEQPQEGEK